MEDLQEREYTLRQQIIYLRKEDDQSIGEHIRTFKGLCDNLAAIGKPVPDKEKVFYLLTSLGHEYETFTTTMLKPPRPSYSELISQLQSHDQRRNWFSNHSDCTTLPLLKWLSMANNNDLVSFPPNIKGILKPSHQLGKDFRLNNP